MYHVGCCCRAALLVQGKSLRVLHLILDIQVYVGTETLKILARIQEGCMARALIKCLSTCF